MRIETKFNIGDEVFYKNDTNQIVSSYVDTIVISSNDNDIWYNLTNYASKAEEDSFRSEQELLAHQDDEE